MNPAVNAGATSGAAAVAAVAQAIKASGAIVRVEPQDFLYILDRHEEPLVVEAQGGLFFKHYRYLTSYKGLAFFSKSPTPLSLPDHVEFIEAKKIWIPE